MQKLSQSAGKNVVGRYQIELIKKNQKRTEREREKTRRVMHKKIQIVNVIGKREHINWHESDMHDLNVGWLVWIWSGVRRRWQATAVLLWRSNMPTNLRQTKHHKTLVRGR